MHPGHGGSVERRDRLRRQPCPCGLVLVILQISNNGSIKIAMHGLKLNMSFFILKNIKGKCLDLEKIGI